MRFVDTNVLVYSVSPAPEDASKRRRAADLLARGDLAFSVQVLQEFYVQSTRPTPWGALTHEQAVTVIDSLTRFPVQSMTLDVLHLGLEFRDRFGLSYWDGAILAAARLTGCDLVYSEDFSHEQDYDGLRVTNPFADAVPGA